ncbi:DEAD/DEAH box helicase family protein [Legionella fallonii]|uniref:Helicase ATP-binding domain-containing protein n=1 Tax=Legionella fallonii LLAP-10 TaxID=1212491 RepID=A0A098G904_9GAMM|nr:DEAD/DEAH box helicase family protein [Legionella fallonii]CEG58446.1 protein of unknown function [Legionella fallonii LLAP-10]
MKLTDNSKKKLLASAQAVYLAYTALDFFKTRVFNTASSGMSLEELCNQAIANQTYDQVVLINNVNYRLVLTPGNNNTFNVQLSRPLNVVTNSVVKKIADYDDEEVLNLLANQEFILEVPRAGGKSVVSSRINEQYVIGGIGKVDLYRTHLVTLHNIIEKIQSEEDISALLVALATGTGKTFVQALWMLILSLSDNNGVFAIPGKLVGQFKKDLKRLLPDNFVTSILTLGEKEPDSQAKAAMKSMAQPSGKKSIIIGSAEHLLDEHYQELIDADPEQTFLVFDEQHLIMQVERRRVRLIELAKQKLSMFLSATPNKETYELSGNKPVAIMSSGQKQQAGQGQFPRLLTHHARNVSDRNQLKDFRFWTADFWNTIFNGILLSLTNSIQEEQSSAAVSLVEDLPFYYYRKESEENVRWRFQVPAARKMLCIIDDNEDLVNFCHALEQPYSDKSIVYRNGNLIEREDVARFFGIPDAEAEVVSEDKRDKRNNYLSSLKEDEYEIGNSLMNKSLRQQLRDNIFHNLIEYVLTDITGLDEIEHNRLRKKDMKAFKQMVISQFALRTADYYQQKLAKEIDADGAHALGELLAGLSKVMNSMLNGTFTGSPEENEKDLEDFIDNWSLYDGLVNKIKRKDDRFSRNFATYTDSHLIMGLMAGMSDAETPVKESCPFSGLEQRTYNLYDHNGIPVSDAKKRKHTSLEILNDTSSETAFTPNYLNISEEVADNYVRLGFIGVYVSNKKTEGFSDRNLHTVINIAEHRLSPTNSPETQIQGIGRNRGLDDTIEPAYIHSLGRGENGVFDLDNLQSDDYYPALFKSQEQFNEESIQILGQNVSKKIIAWIHANQGEDDTLNPEHLKRHVLKYIAQALREINNKNSHQLELSRAQLTRVVSYVMEGINQEIERINKPYSISIFISFLGHILNFLSECYYAVKRIPAAWKMYQYSWFGTRTAEQHETSPKHADDVYIKILSKTSFKDIISNLSSALEFNNWLVRKVTGVTSHITKNLESYVKQEVLDEFAMHQKKCIEPLLVKMVTDSKKEKVAAALAAFPHLVTLLKTNTKTITAILAGGGAQFEATVLALLQQIPGLDDLSIKDIVNYPKSLLQIQGVLAREPEKTLLHNPKSQAELSLHLGNYLKGDFLKHLSSFITYPNVKRIAQALGKEQNAQLFVHHYLTKIINEELESSPESLLSELTSYFKIDGCERLDEAVENLLNEFNTLQLETTGNLLQSLDEARLVRLSTLIQQQLVPVLVNTYPLESRDKLFNEASDLLKIKQLIKEHGKELLAMMQNNKEELPRFIFSKLCSSPLPSPIDIPKQIEESKAFFAQKLQEIMQKSITSLLARKLFSFTSWSLKPEYLYDTAVADLLRSDAFLNTISIMLPYDQWLQLKTKITEDQREMLPVARALIDKAKANGASELSSEDLLELLNKHFDTEYLGSEQALTRTTQSLSGFAAEIAASPLAALDPAVQGKYAQLVSHRLLPILASFINDDVNKEQFLSMSKDDKTLNEFIIRNSNILGTLWEQDNEQKKQTALTLINQLVPEESKFVLKDIVHPQTKAADSAEILAKEVEKISLTAFFRGSAFSDLMKDVLNTQDFSLLMAYINVPEHVALLVDKMLAQGISSLDKQSIFEIIRTSDPSLSAITPMDERADSLMDYIESQIRQSENALDTTKVIASVANSMTPILFHQRFIAVIDEVIGFLDEQDITVLFEAMNKAKPAEEAKQLLAFIDVIRRQDKEALINQFLVLPEDVKTDALEKLPARKMMEQIKDLFEEVLDCHCYYHQQDRKGLEGRDTDPKLINRVSEELRDIRIGSDYNFFSGFSRKIFYIQGIKNGMAAAGQVNADSNQHIVKALQRVNSHILRPLWWGTNVSNFTYSFIKFCRDVVDGIVAGYFAVLNGVKATLNFISGTNYFNVSSKNLDSEDYNNTAFDYAAAINELEPLNAEQVKEHDCHSDVVIELEQFVTKRPSRPGFFKDVAEVIPVETEENVEELSFKI